MREQIKFSHNPNGCNSPIYGRHPKLMPVPVGNAEALREALAGLIDDICFHCDLSEDCKGTPCEKMQKAKAALAKPPRQCDVGTAEEQDERFRDFCPKFVGGTCTGCELRDCGCAECGFAWAQLPYEKGGAK